MSEQRLFQLAPTTAHTDVVLGEYPCDIPFGSGSMEQVTVSLTFDSPRAKHGIPVLRLDAGHHMDFTAREQTPVGHAAKVVADWLNESQPANSIRYIAELFLWQWPGIHQDGKGSWRLVNTEQRRQEFAGRMVNYKGETVATAGMLPKEQILDSSNLQVEPYGFCNKGGPCFLLDACLLCPYFLANANFLDALQERTGELQSRRDEASAANNHRLADACHQALQNIARIKASLEMEE